MFIRTRTSFDFLHLYLKRVKFVKLVHKTEKTNQSVLLDVLAGRN